MRGVGMDAISETIVRPGGVVNGEGGVLYILSRQVPWFGEPGANGRGWRRGVQIVVVHPNGDVGGEQNAWPWGDDGGGEERLTWGVSLVVAIIEGKATYSNVGIV